MSELSIVDAFKALEDVEDIIDVKTPTKTKKVIKENLEPKTEMNKQDESCSLKEEPYLEPEYDSRKSFYNKADVEEDDGEKILYSYGTPVAKITKDNEVKLLSGSLPQTRGYKVSLWKYSPTTLRHVKEFLKQNGFKAESIKQIENDYLTESIMTKKERYLTESESINLGDEEDIKKGKDFLADSEKEDDTIEQIVDVDAETIDELKDSYIGNVILQCPVCRTLIYKKPESLEQCEDDEKLYNCEDECPHCGAKDGFELVGQVASLDVEPEEKETTTGADINEPADEPVEDEPVEDKTSEDEEEVEFDDLEESKFNDLVNKYVHSIYENVDTFSVTGGSVNDKENKLVVEGTIKYKSGKKLNTKFVFEAVSKCSNGKIKFKGLNETFTKAKKPFTVIAHIKNKALVCEELHYNYNVKVLNEAKKVKGKVVIKEKSKK